MQLFKSSPLGIRREQAGWSGAESASPDPRDTEMLLPGQELHPFGSLLTPMLKKLRHPRQCRAPSAQGLVGITHGASRPSQRPLSRVL